jgi:hypothetical protein
MSITGIDWCGTRNNLGGTGQGFSSLERSVEKVFLPSYHTNFCQMEAARTRFCRSLILASLRYEGF